MKVLIVGGVAGGAGAAARLRRLSEDAEIIMFEKGDYISYANCGLPYYIGGTIKEKERLLVTKPKLLRERFNIDVRTNSEVIKINCNEKTVTVKNHADGSTYEENYDKLILSPGAEPKLPKMDGINSEGIFTLRTVPDTYKIDEYIKAKNAKRAVVVGAGFIGVEMAENLRHRGLEVTVVEFLNQVVAPLDVEMAAILHKHIRQNGVQLLLGTGVSGFEKSENQLKVNLTNGMALNADLVIMSIGVAPDSRLANEAGLKLGIGNSIAVNETYQTSDPDIYAVGDAIEVKHLVSGNETLIPLAGPANKQGRAVAENIMGRNIAKHPQVQGSSVLKVFDMTAACTGLNEKQLQKENISYLKTYAHPASHATYYPNALQMSMKLLFSPEGKILGAQAVGFDGVDKRIDVLATALRLGATVYDLEELELCYAPPFSSAKDPVNMLGFTAANILRGDVKVFHYDEVDALDLDKITLLDVRTVQEYQMGTIDGCINIPVDELRTRYNELPKDKPVYVFCMVGLRGYVACRFLTQNGYDCYNLSGGYKTYSMAKEEEQKKPPVDCTGIKNCCDSNTPKEPSVTTEAKVIEVDACGLQCPGPIMKVSENMKPLKDGETLVVKATDPAFSSDISVWCERTGNTLVGVEQDKGIFTVTMKKGATSCPISSMPSGNDKTMVVFSGDLDKAIAAFIIANGAAAMGRKVTMFFTFWGLNILRKNEHVKAQKNMIEKMFGRMMPRGSRKLGLSRMNMGGMGAKMIRGIMKQKNVQSIEELIQAAIDSGIRVVACQMSMDVMGIKPEELIDGVEIGGVATFLGSAELSDTNLFI